MARAASFAAVSIRLIRSMQACRHYQSVDIVTDRLMTLIKLTSCSWFSSSRLPRMNMFQRHHSFGTLTSSPGSIKGDEGVDPQSYPLSVPAEDAYKLHRAGHGYLDVRTRQEFDEGHAAGAVNIPYMISTQQGMSKNPSFMEEVASEFGRDEKIVVGCRSGKRSLMAVEDLRSAGFSKATNIEGGYMEWPDKE